MSDRVLGERPSERYADYLTKRFPTHFRVRRMGMEWDDPVGEFTFIYWKGLGRPAIARSHRQGLLLERMVILLDHGYECTQIYRMY